MKAIVTRYGMQFLRAAMSSRSIITMAAFFAIALALNTSSLFAAEGDKAAAPSQNVLLWIIKTSGLIGAFIFALSVYFGAIVIRSFLELRMQVAAPKEVVEAAEKLIAEKNTKDLLTLLQEDGSYYSQILLAGISELRYGLDDARDKLERKADALTGDMERGISNLAVLGTLGPMIGLLGTLQGMIKSFSQIAISGVALDPAKVAEGISEALILTFEGVILAVPAIYFFSLFRNRIGSIAVATMFIAEENLRNIARSLKTAKPQQVPE